MIDAISGHPLDRRRLRSGSRPCTSAPASPAAVGRDAGRFRVVLAQMATDTAQTLQAGEATALAGIKGRPPRSRSSRR